MIKEEVQQSLHRNARAIHHEEPCCLSSTVVTEGWIEHLCDRVTGQTHGELFGKTISLLGYGTIGQQIAKRAEVFVMKVLIKRRNYEAPGFWTDCDFFGVACPLTEDTLRMIGRYQLEFMRDGAMLINIARP